MAKRMLVTGASGLLGSYLALLARSAYTTFAAGNSQAAAWPGVEPIRLDVADAAAVRAAVRAIRPDVIVHAAALTAVDFCQANPAAAWSVNARGAAHVAAAAAAAGAHLVSISTDYVFDGERGGYREDDPPSPINVYGATKLAGEAAAAGLSPACAVVRTTFYGLHPAGRPAFLARLLERLRRGEEVAAPADSFFSPLPAAALAAAVLELAAAGRSGVYHLGCREQCSKYDFARQAATAFGLDAALVRPVAAADLAAPARRPRDTSLNVDKAAAALRADLPGVAAGLAMVQSMEAKEGKHV